MFHCPKNVVVNANILFVLIKIFACTLYEWRKKFILALERVYKQLLEKTSNFPNCVEKIQLEFIDNVVFPIIFFCHCLFAVCFRYSIFKDQNVTLVTFGAGLCSVEDTENCLVFVNLLDKAVLPVPTCMADGTLVWPKGEGVS